MPDYQAPVVVLGLKETLRALDSMDARTRKAARRELEQAADEIVGLARMLVDPNGLSGWGRWKGGYNPSAIAAGIGRTVVGGKDVREFSRSYVGVVNNTAAGAIWEVAGRKSNGRPPRKGRRRKRTRVVDSSGRGHYEYGEGGKTYGNGQAFVAGIRGKGGDASRTVWAAYDLTDAAFIRRKVEEMVIREGATTQSAIDRNPY